MAAGRDALHGLGFAVGDGVDVGVGNLVGMAPRSAVRTLPDGLMPAVPLLVPPGLASAVALSATGGGLSFWPWMVTVTWVVDLPPAASGIV